MKTLGDARKLAENMVAIGKACGRNVRAVLSNMDVPLGMAIGNALEVQEAAEILQGRGCDDLRGVCMTLAANMVELCNGWDEAYAKQQVHEAVASGKAFAQMKRWIAAQGGDASVLEDFSKLPQASVRHEIVAPPGRLDLPHGYAEGRRGFEPSWRGAHDKRGFDRLCRRYRSFQKDR